MRRAEATATASAGLQQVEFLQNGTTLLGTLTDPPFRITGLVFGEGVHSIAAKATDGFGVSTVSQPITLRIVTQPQLVSLELTTNGPSRIYRVAVSGTPSIAMRLEATDSLKPGSWIDVGTILSRGRAGSLGVTNSIATAPLFQFFRAVVR